MGFRQNFLGEEGEVPLLGWLRRKRPRSEPDVRKPKKDLAALVEELRIAQTLAGFKATRLGIPEDLQKLLQEREQAVITVLEDPFQREIFGILAKHEFNLLEFLGEDWEEVLRKAFREISDFLGKPYLNGSEWEKYPFTGGELYFWILQKARSADPGKELEPIFAGLEKDCICGCDLNFRARQRLVDRLFIVFVGTFAKQTKVFLDIIRDIQDGEEFIKERLMTGV